MTPCPVRLVVGSRPPRAVRPCVALLLAVGWLPPPSAAQAVYGSIAGTVADSSGARAPGATLTITSLDRGTVDTVTSNASGYYLKDRLLPGRYELKAELTGFKTQVVAPVVVGVDAQTKVDPVLEPGEVTEAVTVTATGGQLLKTDRADVATSFEAEQVTDLPVVRAELHEVRAAHAGSPGATLAARIRREPAGFRPDHGERPALQRNRVPARRHRQPRSRSSASS